MKRKTGPGSSGPARPRLRVLLGESIAIGPGKAALLEAIARNGSISAAARDNGMSYRRAWNLVDTMNKCFIAPLVASSAGGQHGGGASLTDLGREVLASYQAMEIKAASGVAREFKAFEHFLAAPEEKPSEAWLHDLAPIKDGPTVMHEYARRESISAACLSGFLRRGFRCSPPKQAPIFVHGFWRENLANRYAGERHAKHVLLLESAAIKATGMCRADRFPAAGSSTPAAERSNRSRTRLMDPPAQALRNPSSGQPRSKRSRFITLVHATTKSLTNFSCASEQA